MDNNDLPYPAPDLDDEEPAAPRRLWWVVLVGLVLLALRATDVVLAPGGAEASLWIGAVLGTLLPVASAELCWVAAGRRRGRWRAAWVLLGVACFVWAVATAAWGTYEALLVISAPSPGPSDAGHLGAVALAVLAMLSFPAARRIGTKLRALLDGLIAAGSLLFLSWMLLLGDMVRDRSGTDLERAVRLAYPASSIVLGAVAILMVARSRPRQRMPWVFIGAGMAVLATAGSLPAYLTVHGGTPSPHLGQAIGLSAFVLIGLGALAWLDHPSLDDESDRVSRAGVVLPYAPVAVAIIVGAVKSVSDDGLGPFLTWNAQTLTVLVLARQLLTMLDNVRLTRELEAKVVARTEELQDREQRFRSMVQNSSDVITVVRSHGTLEYVSPSIERIFGYEPTALVDTRFTDLIHPEDRSRIQNSFVELARRPGESLLLECRIRHSGGIWRYAETLANNLLYDPSVEGVVCNTRDVTDRRVLEEQLRHQAFHDPLTNLANRALFRDRVQHTLARRGRDGQPLAVLLLDLDDFKSVNDTLGHAAGDQLLVAVAKRLSDCTRSADTIARLGGDEFALLADTVDGPEGAETLATRALDALAAPFHVMGNEVFVQASIGIVLSQGTTEPSPMESDDLLRNADVAMYMAKAKGRRRYELFEASMHEGMRERLELQGELRRALEREEFRVHYQPVVDLRTGRLSGVEALIRWAHPRRGLVPPASFIPLAEDSGMIVPIGWWILREACRQVRMWEEAYPETAPLSLSVNLSGRQLQEPRLVEEIARALTSSDLDPSRLTLEITENVLIKDTAANIAKLHEMKALGLRLAIDDFGTGYSSLGYLRSFPVDILKIDRSFVASLGTSSDGSTLARAIVDLGRTFNLETVAEGIENEAQLAELREIGCRYAQGYLFAKPLEPGAMADLLRDGWSLVHEDTVPTEVA